MLVYQAGYSSYGWGFMRKSWRNPWKSQQPFRSQPPNEQKTKNVPLDQSLLVYLQNDCSINLKQPVLEYVYINHFMNVCGSLRRISSVNCLSIFQLSVYFCIYLFIYMFIVLSLSIIYKYIIYMSLSIFVYLYLALSIVIYLYLPLSIFVYLSLSLPIFIYLYLSLSIFIYLYLPLSIFIYLYLSFYPSIYLSR